MSMVKEDGKQVIAAMRAGDLPTRSEALALDALPMIDVLRAEVGSSDLSWLLELLDDPDDERAGLAASMLRYQIEAPGVFETFEKRWASASTHLRFRLGWRMLDKEGLSTDFAQAFFQFVEDEHEEFNNYSRPFYAEGGLYALLKRMYDPKLQQAKRWAYVFNIPAVVDDTEAALILVDLICCRFGGMGGARQRRLEERIKGSSSNRAFGNVGHD